MARLSNLSIVVENTGKRIPIEEIDNSVTSKELLDAVAGKINEPIDTNAVLIRQTTRKQLLLQQTLAEASVESGETLIADFERTPGGRLEFYPDGKLKNIETEPGETPYLAEILREIRNLHSELATLGAKVASISAEIKEIRNSTIVISGNNSDIKGNHNDSGELQEVVNAKRTIDLKLK